MKNFILTTLFLVSVISFDLTAQQISSESYNKDYIHEDFNSPSETFKIVTTKDNYFILDKGDYLLSRNNNDNEYAIIAKKSTVSDFVLKTSIRIGPSDNKRASLGIILKAQNNGKGAIIFEINKKGEYRVKQLIGNTYQALSGNAKKEGWVKSKIVNGIDEHNFIEIRSEKNIFDVYTNSKYLTTFFVPDFTSGSCGLIISPATKARISYFYINLKGNNDLVANYTNEDTKNVNGTVDELKKKIILLEENNAKLNKLNLETKDLQKEEIDRLNSNNKNLARVVNEKEKEIDNLNITISDLNVKSDKITTLETQKTSNLKTIENLENERNTINNKIKESNEKLTESNEKLTEAKEKNSTLAAVSIEQAKEIADLNSTITNLNRRVANMTTLETKNENNLTTIKNLENERNNLSNKIKESNKNLTNAKANNSEFAAISLEQEKEIVSLTSSFNDLKTQTNETQTRNKKLTKKTNELQQQISLEQSINFELTSDLNNLQKLSSSKITKLSKNITKLDKKVISLTDQNNILSSNLSKEKSSNKQINTDLSSSLNSKKSEVNQLKLELERSSIKIVTLSTTQAKHNSIVTDLNTKITDLNKEIQIITTSLNTANNDNTELKATNNKLKDLFVSNDFEISGVESFEIVKDESSKASVPIVLSGKRTIYSVQIGVYMQKPNNRSKTDLDNFWYEKTENGTYVYYSGEFDSPQKVTAHKKKVKELYPNAFVVTITK
jgi:chromosome segregation protein